jgi:hypothetical protein
LPENGVGDEFALRLAHVYPTTVWPRGTNARVHDRIPEVFVPNQGSAHIVAKRDTYVLISHSAAKYAGDANQSLFELLVRFIDESAASNYSEAASLTDARL